MSTKSFDPGTTIKSLQTYFQDRKIRETPLPSLPTGLTQIQLGILKELFLLGGDRVNGAVLSGSVYGKQAPHVSTESIYKECLNLSRDWTYRYPLLVAEAPGTPHESSSLRPVDNFFSLSGIGLLMRDVVEGAAPAFPHLLLNGAQGAGFSIAAYTFDSILKAFEEIAKNPQVADAELLPLIGAPDFASPCLVDESHESTSQFLKKSGTKIILHPEILTEHADDSTTIVVRLFPPGTSPVGLINYVLDNEDEFKGLRKIINTSDDSPSVTLILAKTADYLMIRQQVLAGHCEVFFKCSNNVFTGKGVKEGLTGADLLRRHRDARTKVLAERHKCSTIEAETYFLSELKEIYSTTSLPRSCNPAMLSTLQSETADLPCLALLTTRGLIHRESAGTYKLQNRGGKGVDSLPDGVGDLAAPSLDRIIYGTTQKKLVMATTTGRLYFRKFADLSEGDKDTRGEPLEILFQSDRGEGVTAWMTIGEFPHTHRLLLVTSHGMVKALDMQKYAGAKNAGRAAISLRDADKVVSILDVPPDREIALLTNHGNVARIMSTGIATSLPATKGMKALDLESDEIVVSACVVDPDGMMLTTSSNGNAKFTRFSDIKTVEHNSPPVSVMKIASQESATDCFSAEQWHEIYSGTKSGKILRCLADAIPVTGRSGIGVHLAGLIPGDKLVSVSVHYSEKPEGFQQSEPVPDDISADVAPEGNETSDQSAPFVPQVAVAAPVVEETLSDIEPNLAATPLSPPDKSPPPNDAVHPTNESAKPVTTPIAPSHE